MAHSLLSLQRACGISQVALAERYPNLTVHKVSHMLTAARLQDDLPLLFDILEMPHKAPISYGVQLRQALREMSDAQTEDMLDIAQDAVSDGLRFKPNEALELLGVLPSSVTSELGSAGRKPVQITPIENEDILGHDDQLVGAREQLADHVERLRLPDVAGMNAVQREAAAEAFIAEIRRHFGLA